MASAMVAPQSEPVVLAGEPSELFRAHLAKGRRVDAPKVDDKEAAPLQLSEIPTMFAGLKGRVLYSIAVVAVGTGMRRGELCALRWQDVDLDGASLRVARSLEQTRKGGLRFKTPKTKRGRRTISLSPAVVTELRAHWKKQQEERLALGIGRAATDGLVFATWDGVQAAGRPVQGIL